MYMIKISVLGNTKLANELRILEMQHSNSQDICCDQRIVLGPILGTIIFRQALVLPQLIKKNIGKDAITYLQRRGTPAKACESGGSDR